MTNGRAARIVSCFVLTILAVCAVSEVAFAQEGRLVYIDSYKIRQEYKAFQEAQDVFNTEIDEWNQEGYDLQREVDSLEVELDKQRLILSPAKLKEKQDDIEDKKAALQKFTNDIFGPNGRAEQRNQQLTKPLLDRITAVLEKIAIENNYDYILDAVNGNIAYAKKTLDITEKVLEELEDLR